MAVLAYVETITMNPSAQYQDTRKSPSPHFASDAPLSLAYPGTTSEASPSIAQSFTVADSNHARVDFKDFKRLKAKIDAITFTCEVHELKRGPLASLRHQIVDGRICVPDRRNGKSRFGYPCLAIHDPSLRDLKALIEMFWNSKIMRIEFAIDAALPHGANDLWRLEELKGQLRHCLFPQRHQRLRNALRKRFSIEINRYRPDGLGSPMGNTQVIWESPDCSDQMALYIKQIDNGRSVGQPWVRMEARLQDSGPARAGLNRVGMLPYFANKLRAYLAPMFWIAAGYKRSESLNDRGVPADAWHRWGAQWAARGRANLQPNSEANVLVGTALNELRDSLLRLPVPTALGNRYREWTDEFAF